MLGTHFGARSITCCFHDVIKHSEKQQPVFWPALLLQHKVNSVASRQESGSLYEDVAKWSWKYISVKKENPIHCQVFHFFKMTNQRFPFFFYIRNQSRKPLNHVGSLISWEFLSATDTTSADGSEDNINDFQLEALTDEQRAEIRKKLCYCCLRSAWNWLKRKVLHWHRDKIRF